MKQQLTMTNSERCKAYYIRNREAHKARRRARYAGSSDSDRARARAYYYANREKCIRQAVERKRKSRANFSSSVVVARQVRDTNGGVGIKMGGAGSIPPAKNDLNWWKLVEIPRQWILEARLNEATPCYV